MLYNKFPLRPSMQRKAFKFYENHNANYLRVCCMSQMQIARALKKANRPLDVKDAVRAARNYSRLMLMELKVFNPKKRST